MLRARDTKYTEAFNDVFAREDGGVIRTPYRSPIANCFIESWIGSLKREVLSHLWCFSLRELDYITGVYVTYHNTVWPHQGLGNVPVPLRGQKSPPSRDTEPLGKVDCQKWLGGLIKHYYRKAA